MRLYTLKTDREFIAVESRNVGLVPLSALGFDFKTMNELIDNVTEKDFQKIERLLKTEDFTHVELSADSENVRIYAPIPVPKQDIVCLGVNYSEHIAETADTIDFTNHSATVYFSKRVNVAIGCNDTIPHYDFVNSLN